MKYAFQFLAILLAVSLSADGVYAKRRDSSKQKIPKKAPLLAGKPIQEQHDYWRGLYEQGYRSKFITNKLRILERRSIEETGRPVSDPVMSAGSTVPVPGGPARRPSTRSLSGPVGSDFYEDPFIAPKPEKPRVPYRGPTDTLPPGGGASVSGPAPGPAGPSPGAPARTNPLEAGTTEAVAPAAGAEVRAVEAIEPRERTFMDKVRDEQTRQAYDDSLGSDPYYRTMEEEKAKRDARIREIAGRERTPTERTQYEKAAEERRTLEARERELGTQLDGARTERDTARTNLESAKDRVARLEADAPPSEFPEARGGAYVSPELQEARNERDAAEIQHREAERKVSELSTERQRISDQKTEAGLREESFDYSQRTELGQAIKDRNETQIALNESRQKDSAAGLDKPSNATLQLESDLGKKSEKVTTLETELGGLEDESESIGNEMQAVREGEQERVRAAKGGSDLAFDDATVAADEEEFGAIREKYYGTTRLDEEDHSISSMGTKDKCGISDKLDKKFGCDGTERMLQIGQISNVVGQQLGSLATAGVGQAEANRALEKGSQSAALKGAARTARTSAYAETTLGLTNLVTGIANWVNGNEHLDNADEIEANLDGRNVLSNERGRVGTGQEAGEDGYVTGKNDLAIKAVEKFKLNSFYRLRYHVRNTDDVETQQRNYGKRADEFDQKRRAMGADVNEIRDLAAEEQHGIGQDAKEEGIFGVAQGLVNGIKAFSFFKSAQELDKAADALKNSEKPPVTFNPGADPFPAPPDAPRGGLPFNPNTGQSPQVASAEDGDDDDTIDELGDGIDPNDTGDIQPSGLDPGERVAASPPGGNRGGGGSGIGFGDTPREARDESGAEAKASPFKTGIGSLGYRSGANSGRSGRRRAGKSGNVKLDPLSLLAKFLPGQKDAEKKSINDLLVYGNGRRVASSLPRSLLGRDTNLFERIHDAYQAKARSGIFKRRKR